ncbi:MAG: hypothetical protein EAZ90_04285 [Oscillatoriales cyanobacterium]|nr:MAG: hypothetical protein EAZ90_04285 [Oscillatoriales cyanobacterium]
MVARNRVFVTDLRFWIVGGWRETGFLRQTWRQLPAFGKNPVSVVLREYRRVRRYQIYLNAIELLTATHDTKYSLTTETCVHKKYILWQNNNYSFNRSPLSP